MITCTSCGAQVPDNNYYCPRCGAALPTHSTQSSGNRYDYYYKQPRSQGGYSSPNPAYVYTSPKRQDSVLSTGAFLLSIILMSLPLAGFILQIVWACGATRNLNRRNLARAYLILSLICIALYVIFSAILFSLDWSGFFNHYFPFKWEYFDFMNLSF
ncbi:MAG: zinc-ribbon domain-containing protein [Oscillospiraceae bacterium]|jgi:predicted amidophosphoribosyltransferase